MQPVEILGRAVIGVDNIGLDVAGGRHAVVGGFDARIAIEGIAINVLGARAVHLDTGGRGHIDVNLRGVVEPDFVFDDLRIEPGGAEFGGDVLGGGLVFGRAGNVRGLRQRAQVLLGKFGIGYGYKLLLDFLFGGNVAEPGDGSD